LPAIAGDARTITAENIGHSVEKRMGTEIGKLAVMITADTRGFQRGVEQAKSDAKSLKRDVATSSGGVGTAGVLAISGEAAAAATGIAAIAAAAIAAKSAFSSMASEAEQTMNAADALSMDVVAYQELAASAELAGTSIAVVDRILGRIEQRLGEARSGSDDAADAFEKLGLSVDQMERLKPEEQFEAVSKALVGIEDGATRAAIANELLGKGWREAWGAMKDAASGNLHSYFTISPEALAAIDYVEDQITLLGQFIWAVLVNGVGTALDWTLRKFGVDVDQVIAEQKSMNVATQDQKYIRDAMARHEQEAMRDVEERARQGQRLVDYVKKLKEDLTDLQTGRTSAEREAAEMLEQARTFYGADEFKQYQAEVNEALALEKRLREERENSNRAAMLSPSPLARSDSMEAYNMIATAQNQQLARDEQGKRLDKIAENTGRMASSLDQLKNSANHVSVVSNP
jgi:hypothetical protein